MAEEETRQVRTEFTAHDAGVGSVLARHENMAGRAAHAIGHLNERFSEFRREQGLTTLAALGLGYGLGSWMEKLKEANAEARVAQKGIAGVLAGALAFDKGTAEIDRYRQSFALAREIMEHSENTAARFGMSLEEVSNIYKKLAVSVGGLGLSQEQVQTLTDQTAATAKRFGVSGEQAASSIARAMRTGAIRGVDEFSLSLGKAIGNMHKLSQAQRFEHVQKALGGSMQIADAMSTGIDASLIRVRNTVSQMLRSLTSPIFGEIATRLDAWAKHLKEAKEGARSLVTEYADRLLSVFRTAADVVGKIREHWVAIAAVMAGVKLSNSFAAGGALSGLGAMGGGRVGALGGILGTATITIGTAYLLGTAIGELLGNHMVEFVKATNKATSALGDLSVAGVLAKNVSGGGHLTDQQQRIMQKTIDAMTKSGMIAETLATGRTVDRAAIASAMKEAGKGGDQSNLQGLERAFGPRPTNIGGQAGMKASQQWIDNVVNQVSSLLLTAGQRTIASKGIDPSLLKFSKQPVVNINGGVHVQMKFEDEDPDNVFVRLKDKFENYVDQKTQSAFSEHLAD